MAAFDGLILIAHIPGLPANQSFGRSFAIPKAHAASHHINIARSRLIDLIMNQVKIPNQLSQAK
jgi:hypothetical protein